MSRLDRTGVAGPPATGPALRLGVTLALGLTLSLVPASGVEGQAAATQGSCAGDRPAWSWIGVGGFHCQGGSCVLGRAGARVPAGGAEAGWATMYPDPEGRDREGFDFSVEPRVGLVGGPARGLLRSGDVLVAVDGLPITSREGGRRLARVESGEIVSVLVRRDERYLQVEIESERTCAELRLSAGPGEAPSGGGWPALGWGGFGFGTEPADRGSAPGVTPDTTPDATPGTLRWRQTFESDSSRFGTVDALRFPTADWSHSSTTSFSRSWGGTVRWRMEDPGLSFRSGPLRFGTGPPAAAPPGATLAGPGLVLEGPTAVEVANDGRVRWRFAEAPAVAAVVSGSPAERAGIGPGWIVLEADGRSLGEPEGTEALAAFRGGAPLPLLVRVDGELRTVVLR